MFTRCQHDVNESPEVLYVLAYVGTRVQIVTDMFQGGHVILEMR